MRKQNPDTITTDDKVAEALPGLASDLWETEYQAANALRLLSSTSNRHTGRKLARQVNSS
jgi:hypothetical protein